MDFLRFILIFLIIMSITASNLHASLSSVALANEIYPTSPKYPKLVRNLFLQIKNCRIKAFVRDFSSFYSRSAILDYGHGQRSSENWLRKEINSLINVHNSNYVSFRKMSNEHTRLNFNQESFIVHLEGQDKLLKTQHVIVGAHYDSRNSLGLNRKAPGADDNATGCAVVLELLRILLESRVKFRRTVEFHWYGGEEFGLLGSFDVAMEYRKKQVEVIGMLNLDSLGHQVVELGKTIKITKDYTEAKLSSFVEILVKNYLEEYRVEVRNCGYICSDHASWWFLGFPSAFLSEVESDEQRIHSEWDTIGFVNFQQVKDIAKLASAFVIELGHPATTTEAIVKNINYELPNETCEMGSFSSQLTSTAVGFAVPLLVYWFSL